MTHKFIGRQIRASLMFAASLAITSLTATSAKAQTFYIGEIIPVAFSFCPRSTLSAEGQILPINTNQSLFALYGTYYGGDGRTSFGIPDLRGRTPMGNGSQPGLTPRALGARGGAVYRSLVSQNLPSHTHVVNANNLDGDKPGPGGKLLAAAPTGGTGNETIYSKEPSTVDMNPLMIANTGGGQQFDTLDPYITIRYCVVTQGLFPPRS